MGKDILISNDITIQGVENASITCREGYSCAEVTFLLQYASPAELSFVSLTIKDIKEFRLFGSRSFKKTHAPLKPVGSIAFRNCLFDNVHTMQIDKVNETNIFNTRFQDVTDVKDDAFYITRVKHFNVVNTVFRGVSDWEFKAYELKDININISKTLFFESKVKVTGNSLGKTTATYGSLSVDQCLFYNISTMFHESTLHIGGIKDVSIRSTKFNSTASIRGRGLKILQCNARVIKCSFIKTSGEVGGAILSQISGLTVINSLFIKTNAMKGGAIYGSFCRTLGTVIKIRGSLFYGCFARTGGTMDFQNCDLFLDNSILRGNWAKLSNGGIGLYSTGKGLQDKRVLADIRSTLLENNTAPALEISAAKITLNNITLHANTVLPGTHVKFIAYEIQLDSIHTNTTYAASPRSNVIQSAISLVSYSGSVVSTKLKFSCSRYFHVALKSDSASNNTKLKVDVNCATCGPNMYSLINDLEVENITKTAQKQKLSICKNCPPGAICNGNIRLLDNHWGTKGMVDDLKVFPCPKGYCCSSQSTPCVNHNTCNAGRRGTLCGSCKSDYMLSFFHSDCIPREEQSCNVHVFITYITLTSWAYTSIFTLLPALLVLLKTLQCRKTATSDEKVAADEDDSEAGTLISSVEEEKPIPLGAVFTQIVFFFQLASLVHVDVLQRKKQSATHESENAFVKSLFDTFNFRFSVYGTVCPTKDLTFVEKLAIQLALKVNTLINIFWILVVYKAISFVICRGKKHDREHDSTWEGEELQDINISPSSSNDDQLQDENAPLSFMSQLKIGFLKLFKLNFSSTMIILIQLVHCEPIRSRYHLFVSGDYICYTWWQWSIMIVFLPVLALFPLSFGMALNMLKEQRISTSTFLVSCVLPFAFYFRRMSKDIKNSDEEEKKCVRTILEQEEELFTSESKGIRWPVIQLYRLLVIVVLNNTIHNPIFRILLFFAIFLAFVVHDGNRKPYHHPFLNFLQRVTSACLFLVNLCSTPSSFSSVGNITSVPNMDICLTILRYLKLSVYIFVLLSLPMWKLREKYYHHEMEKKKKDI